MPVDDTLVDSATASGSQTQVLLNRLHNCLLLVLNYRIVIDDLHQSQSIVNLPLIQQKASKIC